MASVMVSLHFFKKKKYFQLYFVACCHGSGTTGKIIWYYIGTGFSWWCQKKVTCTLGWHKHPGNWCKSQLLQKMNTFVKKWSLALQNHMWIKIKQMSSKYSKSSKLFFRPSLCQNKLYTDSFVFSRSESSLEIRVKEDKAVRTCR